MHAISPDLSIFRSMRVPAQVVGFGLWATVAVAVAVCAVAFFSGIALFYKASFLFLGIGCMCSAYLLCKDDAYAQLAAINEELKRSVSALRIEVREMAVHNAGLARTNASFQFEVDRLRKNIEIFREYIISLSSIVSEARPLSGQLREALGVSQELFTQIQDYFCAEQQTVSENLTTLGQLIQDLRDDSALQVRLRELLTIKEEFALERARLTNVREQIEIAVASLRRNIELDHNGSSV